MTCNKIRPDITRDLNYDPLTGAFTWKVSERKKRTGAKAGCVKKDGYHYVKHNNKAHLSHRLAWFMFYGVHIDGNKQNNKISNLRDVSRSENMQNQRLPHKTNSSGFLGVTSNKQTGKFVASIRVNGKSVFLGAFVKPQDAHFAYVAAKRQHHAGCML